MVTLKKKFHSLDGGSIDFESWFNKIRTHSHLKDHSLIIRAAKLADLSSKGLTTFYGQPCIEQGLEMAEILLEMKLDQDSIAAAITISAALHTSITIEKIQQELSDPIAKLVHDVLQMNVLNNLKNYSTRSKIQIDQSRKIFLAMVSDIRVVLIKLAERTCMMRGIKNINQDERRKIAQETMDIYAPLANRLGIGQLKWELEDAAFHYIDPETYKTIASFLAERRIDREQRIEDTIKKLKSILARHHIKSEIQGRAKHIYSIYVKSFRKHLGYENIYDYNAVRILVPKIEDCYTALSVVHSLFTHVPEEFDDYISRPKPNGYRSIHTAVILPNGKNLEIQIRTHNMHEEAEHGVAAHWVYKEHKTPQSGYEAKITFLRQLLDWHKDVAQHGTAPDKKLDEILDDTVYVFSPEGEIIDLPKGATPLDFAYRIHSELGHRCRGAKIKGHIVPLTYQLRTGDQIEIITTPHGGPSRDWLNKDFGYLYTSRARSKAAHWFKQQEISQYIETGKNNLERELSRAGISNPNFEKIAARFNYKNDEALFASIGHGNVRIAQIIHALQSDQQPEINKQMVLPLKQTAELQGNMEIAGINDLLTRIAKCCKPIPGDQVIGYITQGRGVSIHRQDCNNINLTRNANRIIQVSWDSKKLGKYYVDLQIRASGQQELLKEITALLTNAKIDLVNLSSTISRKDNMIYIVMTIQIHDLIQLKQLISQISQLPKVIDIKRMRK
ncbi:MAG TPA: bifunctional (p)ppGpp synthetase/guanosine-3',5'-bis(diphosphate) 3'-pyrophosphohydrolase [Gammaproteobacteria bacterium]|nr:bifunctional (p)ppGpp synthetase/guanosine-3',5'-bis(diphosphate) 3'-pyrophosphohydrolase [Gammaproteobacteria bacterium]